MSFVRSRCEQMACPQTATSIAQWPSKALGLCSRHAVIAQEIARSMGFELPITHIDFVQHTTTRNEQETIHDSNEVHRDELLRENRNEQNTLRDPLAETLAAAEASNCRRKQSDAAPSGTEAHETIPHIGATRARSYGPRGEHEYRSREPGTLTNRELAISDLCRSAFAINEAQRLGQFSVTERARLLAIRDKQLKQLQNFLSAPGDEGDGRDLATMVLREFVGIDKAAATDEAWLKLKQSALQAIELLRDA